MTLPRPNCLFKIPSLHDDLELDCRLYYPNPGQAKATERCFRNSYAIIAHPYAPLGGSFDDPVVALIGKVLLRKGYVLGTFNFRGAAGSAGRNSWSGKAELSDYVSFYAFMLWFLSCISSLLGKINTQIDWPKPLLILGGYSYGSMMAQNLPALQVVTSVLNDVKEDSSIHEIRLRAEHLAKDLTAYLNANQHGELPERERSGIGETDMLSPVGRNVMSLGGYESNNASRRISRESSRKSIDAEKVKKSLERVRQKLKARNVDRAEAESGHGICPTATEVLDPGLAYLLVSPILPPVAGFATFFTRLNFENKYTNISEQKPVDQLVTHHSCAIYGSKDVFCSVRKLEKWSYELSKRPNSRFSSHTIQGAGHFWHEDGVAVRMQTVLRDWLDKLERDHKTLSSDEVSSA